jgi:hypothetical protein
MVVGSKKALKKKRHDDAPSSRHRSICDGPGHLARIVSGAMMRLTSKPDAARPPEQI